MPSLGSRAPPLFTRHRLLCLRPPTGPAWVRDGALGGTPNEGLACPRSLLPPKRLLAVALWELLTSRLTGVTPAHPELSPFPEQGCHGPPPPGAVGGTDEAAPARPALTGARAPALPPAAGHEPRLWAEAISGDKPLTAPAVLAAESSRCPADLSPKTDGGHAFTVPKPPTWEISRGTSICTQSKDLYT